MKAKFFQIAIAMEIQLSIGVSYQSTEGQTKEDFIAEVTAKVSEEFVEELELTEVSASSLSKKANKALVAMFETSVGLEKEMVAGLLQKRGVEITAANSTEGAETTEAPVAKTKKEKPAKKEKVVKEKVVKEVKEKREKLSLNDVLDAAKDAKVNVGKVVEFVPFRSAFKLVGEINQVVVDTRVNRAYYRILILETGKLQHSEITNSTIIVDEEATEKLATERAAELKTKAAAKKEKAVKEVKPKKEKVAKAKAVETEETPAEEAPSMEGVYIAPEVSGDDETAEEAE